MSKRLTGAALQAKVTAELRKMLAEDYGLPMGDYTADVRADAARYPGEIPNLYAVFTHKRNHARIMIDNIFTRDNGELDQMSAPELR